MQSGVQWPRASRMVHARPFCESPGDCEALVSTISTSQSFRRHIYAANPHLSRLSRSGFSYAYAYSRHFFERVLHSGTDSGGESLINLTAVRDAKAKWASRHL